jgi:HAMP domain-containing protein
MSTGEKYVTAAYLVLLGALLLYIALIAMKLSRIQRELDELARLAKERAGG